MAVNSVTLRILGDPKDATAKMDKVLGQFDKLRETFDRKALSLDLNDKVAVAKMHSMGTRLERLGEQIARPTVDVRGIDKSLGKVLAIDAALDKLGNKTVTAKAKVSKSGGGIGGLSGLLEKGTSLLSLSGDSLGGTGGGVAGIAAIAAIAQGLGVASVAATGLAAALAPIAGSILPLISKQWGQFEKLISGTKAGKQAIGAASEAFHALLAAITPLVIKMLPSLTRLLTNIGKSATSGGLSTFLTWLAVNGPKAFNAVSRGVTIAGHAIHTMQPIISVVADNFKIFFRVLDAGFDLIGAALDLLTGNWSAAGHRMQAVWNNLKGAFHDLVDAFKNEITFIGSLFGGLPGRIVRALGNLGHLLYSAGENIIDGLISGIESKIGPLGGVMQRVLSIVGDFLPHSPAKRGPLSGSGSPQIAGAKIATMLAAGITQGGPHVANAANGLAQHVANSYGASMHHASNGGSSSATLEIEFRNGNALQRQLFELMVKETRTRGGDPKMYTRKVAFA